MKIAIIYDSKTGNTTKAAECIAEGARAVAGAEVRTFPIADVDAVFVNESAAVIVGCPTYMAEMTADMHVWLEKGTGGLNLAGKLGGAFATEQYVHGGAENVISNLLTVLMVRGMLVYSGGAACGRPVIHLGPVALSPKVEDFRDTLVVYGTRMAEQAARVAANR